MSKITVNHDQKRTAAEALARAIRHPNEEGVTGADLTRAADFLNRLIAAIRVQETHTDDPALAQAERQMNQGQSICYHCGFPIPPTWEDYLRDALNDIEEEERNARDAAEEAHADSDKPASAAPFYAGKAQGLSLAARIVNRYLSDYHSDQESRSDEGSS